MARRSKRSEHDNQDRWLVSYADFVTLLFAFFVVMYSISSVNEGKYKTFSESLNQAFLKRSDATSAQSQQEQILKTLVDRRDARLGEQQRKVQERMKALADNVGQVMLPMVNQGLVNISQNKRGVVVDISATLLFKTGTAALEPAVLNVLRQVAAVLAREDQPIEVEGHTDDVPISNQQFPSNWELSSARASSVARLLIDNGVQARRLAVVGLADNHPLLPNNSAENRAKNRRVTITILSPNVERDGSGVGQEGQSSGR